MSEVIRESDTFFGLVARALETAADAGRISEKKIVSALGVPKPTAAKIMCALALIGALGEKHGGKYAYAGEADATADVRKRAEEFPQDYLPMVEEDKAFKAIGAEGYMTGTLLPAVRICVLYGSVSVIFLQRKMSVGYERAHEIFDIIAACGFLGEEDEINPGRRKVNIGYSDYDRLFAALGGGK